MKLLTVLFAVAMMATTSRAQLSVDTSPPNVLDQDLRIAYIIPPMGGQALFYGRDEGGVLTDFAPISMDLVLLEMRHSYEFWVMNGTSMTRAHAEWRGSDQRDASPDRGQLAWELEVNLADSGPDQWIKTTLTVERRPNEPVRTFLNRAREFIKDVILDPNYRIPPEVHEDTTREG